MELEPTGTRVPEVGSALSEGPYWKALQRHRLMVLKNLIPCDEFFQIIASCRIFTSTIIDNIKACASREEKNRTLLDLLSMYGNDAIAKFTDALYMSGHIYLSELIQNSVSSSDPNEENDDSPKFPKLKSRSLTPDELAQISIYIDDAIKTGVLKQIWEEGGSEKERAINRKQKQIQDGWKFVETLEDQQKQICDLTEKLRTAQVELAEKTEKLEKYPKLMEELECKHKAEQQVQVSFNQANERSIQRLTQRELERERILDRMFFRMVEFVENEQARLTANKPWTAGAGGREKLYRETSITIVEKLEDVMEHVMRIHEKTTVIRNRCEFLEDEKRFILGFMDRGSMDESVKEIFAGFVRRNEEATAVLKKKVASLKSPLKDTKTELGIAEQQIISLTNDVESLKTSLKLKESQAMKLGLEKFFLKDIITLMKKSTLRDKQGSQLQNQLLQNLKQDPTGNYFSQINPDEDEKTKLWMDSMEEVPSGNDEQKRLEEIAASIFENNENVITDGRDERTGALSTMFRPAVPNRSSAATEGSTLKVEQPVAPGTGGAKKLETHADSIRRRDMDGRNATDRSGKSSKTPVVGKQHAADRNGSKERSETKSSNRKRGSWNESKKRQKSNNIDSTSGVIDYGKMALEELGESTCKYSDKDPGRVFGEGTASRLTLDVKIIDRTTPRDEETTTPSLRTGNVLKNSEQVNNKSRILSIETRKKTYPKSAPFTAREREDSFKFSNGIDAKLKGMIDRQIDDDYDDEGRSNAMHTTTMVNLVNRGWQSARYDTRRPARTSTDRPEVRCHGRWTPSISTDNLFHVSSLLQLNKRN